MQINNFNSFIFDCDGVLLDSNSIKSEAFYKVALKYDKVSAETFLKYHINNAGVSRFIKFEYLFRDILKYKKFQREIKMALDDYSKYIEDELLSVKKTSSLDLFKVTGKSMFVVSGSEQEQLRMVLKKRNLYDYFDGIYGSPLNKYEIIDRLIENDSIKPPVVFFGDSKYDYEVSMNFDFDFIFISDWTEMSNWENFCNDYNIKNYKKLEEFFNETT